MNYVWSIGGMTLTGKKTNFFLVLRDTFSSEYFGWLGGESEWLRMMTNG